MRSIAALLLLIAVSAQAETVFVKYRGNVSLDDFRCVAPTSSLVHRVCYREDQQYLIVLLDRTYYHYCRIPPAEVRRWLATDSVGRYYNQQIKGNFDCRLGGVPN